MNLATGVFTAPVDGIYHFEFSSLKDATDPSSIFITLQVNGVGIGTAYATNLPNYLGFSGINAYLRLKTGDRVTLYKTGGALQDDNRYTHFTGSLVDEELLVGYINDF